MPASPKPNQIGSTEVPAGHYLPGAAHPGIRLVPPFLGLRPLVPGGSALGAPHWQRLRPTGMESGAKPVGPR